MPARLLASLVISPCNIRQGIFVILKLELVCLLFLCSFGTQSSEVCLPIKSIEQHTRPIEMQLSKLQNRERSLRLEVMKDAQKLLELDSLHVLSQDEFFFLLSRRRVIAIEIGEERRRLESLLASVVDRECLAFVTPGQSFEVSSVFRLPKDGFHATCFSCCHTSFQSFGILCRGSDVLAELVRGASGPYGARPDEQTVDRLFGESFARAREEGHTHLRLDEMPT